MALLAREDVARPREVGALSVGLLPARMTCPTYDVVLASLTLLPSDD